MHSGKCRLNANGMADTGGPPTGSDSMQMKFLTMHQNSGLEDRRVMACSRRPGKCTVLCAGLMLQGFLEDSGFWGGIENDWGGGCDRF